MKVYTVDAFTSEPFNGNPAGVCVLEKPLKEDLYLKIAAEINYSETAFLLKQGRAYSLRWFTPTTEVDLCGHATLASAKILYSLGLESSLTQLKFETRSGLLTAKLVNDKIELNFPQEYIKVSTSDSLLEKAFRVKPTFVGVDGPWVLLEVETEKELNNISPDFELLKTHDKKIFVVTSKSTNANYDFYSRCFGPAVGINEDPVTGSAHCYLATYWGEKLNKTKTIGFQASHRTGVVECELTENSRVLLSGDAVIMSKIEFSGFSY